MFSLILTIISILLVALIAIAVIYYGGSEFTSANSKAQVATLVNQGAQIQAATLLYENDNAGNIPSSITTLISGGYLASTPQNWDVTQSGAEIAYTKVSSSTVCEDFNKKYGVTGVPSCSSISTNQPVCCQ